jgi:sec-independent protein translocase protein TatB
MSLIPQVGFLEIILLAMLALIVIGPKDLPKLMNRVGRFMAQMRNLANEFRAGFDQMAREAEMEELRQEIQELKKANPLNEISKAAEDVTKPLQETMQEPLQEQLPEPASSKKDTSSS